MDFSTKEGDVVEWDIIDQEIEILSQNVISLDDVINFYENLIFNEQRKAVFRVFSEKFGDEAKQLDLE